MNNEELTKKVHSAMYHQCQERGFAAPVDVLIDIGALQKNKYEDWRFGRINYLEAVCTTNLGKLSLIMRQMHVYAKKEGLKSSTCYYKQWGKKKNNGAPLRFSKSGTPEIEKSYSTHFVYSKRVGELKVDRKKQSEHDDISTGQS